MELVKWCACNKQSGSPRHDSVSCGLSNDMPGWEGRQGWECFSVSSPVSVSLTWPHKHECFSRAMTQKCLNHTQTHARFQFIGKGSCTVRGDTLENHNTCRNTLKGLQGHSGNISPEQPPTGADISQLAQLALQLAIQTGSSEWYRELRSHPFLWISSDKHT